MKYLPIAFALVLLAGCSVPGTAPGTPKAAASSAAVMPTPTLMPNLGRVSTPEFPFYLPDFVAVDAQDNLYVVDEKGLERLDASGKAVLIAAQANPTVQTDVDRNRTLTFPLGLTVAPDGTIYIASKDLIYKVTPAGAVSSLPSPEKDFQLAGIAVDHSGNIFLALPRSNYIAKVTPDGTASVFAGKPVASYLATPAGCAGDEGGFKDGKGTEALFRIPNDLAIDAQDNLYVADMNNAAIRKITPNGWVSTLVGQGFDCQTSPSPVPEASTPPRPSPSLAPGVLPCRGLTVDSAGNVYVAGGDWRIRKVTSDGQATVIAGNGIGCHTAYFPENPPPDVSACEADGQGSAAGFYQPSRIAVTRSGTLYVSDWASHHLRKIE